MHTLGQAALCKWGHAASRFRFLARHAKPEIWSFFSFLLAAAGLCLRDWAATALVGRVVDHARGIPWCQGVFLHVVAYNTPAIRFYSRLNFVCLRRAPSFYSLEGRLYDAYVFVLFMNGGQPPSASLRSVA